MRRNFELSEIITINDQVHNPITIKVKTTNDQNSWEVWTRFAVIPSEHMIGIAWEDTGEDSPLSDIYIQSCNLLGWYADQRGLFFANAPSMKVYGQRVLMIQTGGLDI